MPAASPQRDQANRDEILAAAQGLYAQRDFKDISLGDIAKLTSLSRPSIYNYFKSKEEIFLALLTREHELWTQKLRGIDPKEVSTPDALADALAATLDERELMLKLMVANLYDMENNSSIEALVALKERYWEAAQTVRAVTAACLPAMSEEALDEFIKLFFPFAFGLYPYTHHSKMQLEAMEIVGIPVAKLSIHELARPGILGLLESQMAKHPA